MTDPASVKLGPCPVCLEIVKPCGRQTKVEDTDVDNLIQLAKDTLKALDKFSRSPHYFVQPGLGIVLKHKELIRKFKLL